MGLYATWRFLAAAGLYMKQRAVIKLVCYVLLLKRNSSVVLYCFVFSLRHGDFHQATDDSILNDCLCIGVDCSKFDVFVLC